nr:MAG TPA: hypothetical protein [Caudoviricetes sp.]
MYNLIYKVEMFLSILFIIGKLLIIWLWKIAAM